MYMRSIEMMSTNYFRNKEISVYELEKHTYFVEVSNFFYYFLKSKARILLSLDINELLLALHFLACSI